MDYRDFKESQAYTRAQIEAQAKQRAMDALSRTWTGDPRQIQQLHGQSYATFGAQVQYMGSMSSAQASSLALGGQAKASNKNSDSPESIQYEINKIDAHIRETQKKMATPSKLFIKSKEKHMFGFAKEYLDKHKDTVMTVVVALLVDHFFLGGALREKIKAITESILDNAQKKLSHTPNAESKDVTKEPA